MILEYIGISSGLLINKIEFERDIYHYRFDLSPQNL